MVREGDKLLNSAGWWSGSCCGAQVRGVVTRGSRAGPARFSLSVMSCQQHDLGQDPQSDRASRPPGPMLVLPCLVLSVYIVLGQVTNLAAVVSPSVKQNLHGFRLPASDIDVEIK